MVVTILTDELKAEIYLQNLKDSLKVQLENLDLHEKVTAIAPLKKRLSPLRYPGGKSRMIDYLSTLLRPEKCDTLISPFLGGGAFEISLLEAGVAKKLILNDLDYGIYSLWWTILHMPDTLISRIESFKPTHKAFFQAQQLIKSDYRHLDMLEAAWITLLVNRLAYSGIAKANPLGGKNGDIKSLTSRWNPRTLISRINGIYALADKIEIHCEDAVTFIENHFWEENATLFIDPPYFEKGHALYNLFFTEKDHINLAWTLQTIHDSFPSSDVIVTYDFHDFIDGIYNKVEQREVIGRQYSI
ncbi:DNA adenine methylase [Solibacillus sp. NPDC093137]|uniref:DNA adenine methylase n=1 Tax=Solibacillus sp. NPDC093137 TaxID=3390678 RepID=UPI003CFDC6A4